MSAHTPRMFKHGHTFQNLEQEPALNTHIDQLTEWWDAAEQGATINKGDIVIEDRRDREGGFDIWPAHDATQPLARSDRRILARAPKPEPAWHDAPAVIASHVGSAHRSTWTPDPIVPGMWITDDDQRDAADLRDVIPLIEAKVTDEMVKRGAQASTPAGVRYLRPHEVREVLTAALGIDPA